jgi:hypothetical protein
LRGKVNRSRARLFVGGAVIDVVVAAASVAAYKRGLFDFGTFLLIIFISVTGTITNTIWPNSKDEK